MSSTTSRHEGKARATARKSRGKKGPATAARGTPDGLPAPGHHLSLLRRMLAIRRFEKVRGALQRREDPWLRPPLHR